MNKITKAIFICLALIVIGVIYKETSVYQERKQLSEEIHSIETLLSKYEQILHEADKLERKYAILKNRELNDEKSKDLLAKVEKFLKNSTNIKIKYVKLLEDHKRLADSYNTLTQQVLLYHGSLPKMIKSET
jgi:chemotaxis regulatin CheY-phosphate phosphatase CheZ